MQKVIQICCVNQHPATELCSSPQCPHPSPICDSPNCQHSKLHQLCTYIKSRSLNQKLTKNRELGLNKQEKLLLETLNNMIKDIQMFKNQYLNQRQTNPQLQENVIMLKNIIQNKKWKDIKPQMIYNLTNSTIKHAEPKLQQHKIIQLRKIIQIILQENRDRLLNIKNAINTYETLSTFRPKNFLYKFRYEDTNPKQIQIFNNQKSIRHFLNSGFGDLTVFRSLIFCEDILNQKTIKLKLIENNSKRAGLGIVIPRMKTNSSNQLFQNLRGFIEPRKILISTKMFQASGKICCQGDTIQMKFLDKYYFEFENLRTKDKELISFDSSYQFAFFVTTYAKGDEWEIVND